MGGSTKGIVSTRLKREDCKRTKHDSVFSQWKVLIGPSDWEDHHLGKEGAERYRVHNLPNSSSCSGLYELGIAIPLVHSARDARKLDPDHIIPVYLGQADNVRARLQSYGREGSHLENGRSIGEPNESVQHGPRLFSEVFSRGYSVVYRWAPMKSKRDAEKTEAQLLETFDYAWNRGNNGIRRPSDIIQKIHKIDSRKSLFTSISRKLQNLHKKKVGIKIEACKPIMLGDSSATYSNQEDKNLLFQIFKIGRSWPRQVSPRNSSNDNNLNICGVALGHGSVCRRVPVEGRKRCADHKGMKINGFTSKLIAEGKPLADYGNLESSFVDNLEHGGHYTPSFSHGKMKSLPIADNSFPNCGITLGDGSSCRRRPVKGRKRCEEHKGRRVIRSVSKSGKRSKQFSL
ncbi:hypothetical protein NMG60_11013643 [Bertholletia excelsa]